MYGWSNESSIYIYMFALAVLAVSAMSGSPVIARIGSYNALKLGILVVASGFIVLIFAQASPALAYIGILVMASGGFASPAFLTIISTLVSSSEQGELQGAVNSVVLLSSGLGAVFHSAIFTWVKHTSIGASLPFLLGAVCVLASFGATGVAMWSPYRRGRSTDASPLQLPASPAVGHIDAGVELPQLAPPAPAPPEDSSDVIPLRPFNE